MTIIKNASETIVTYWGKQPYKKDTIYRLIRYHVEVNYRGRILLLNTITGEMVLLTVDEQIAFKNLPSKGCGYLKPLIEHHFLVPVDYNEQKSVDQLRLIFNKMKRDDCLTGYSILPTTNCNARCFYCFESDDPKENMSSETADLVAEYIRANHNDQKVWINWFGGEPMVGYPRIDQICEKLTKYGIEYSSSMLSNGSLFSKELAQKARELWNLRRIQITIDGSEEIYNKVKAYVGMDGNPYYRVLSNIGYLLDEGIHVNVRLNMDFHNLDDLPIVVDDLLKRFGGRKEFFLYVNELFEDEGFHPVHHSREERRVIEEKRAYFEEFISEKRFECNSDQELNEKEHELPSFRYQYCMADNPRCVVINPLGQLAKCEHHTFRHMIGDIHDAGNGISKIRKAYWMNPDMEDYCKDCALYPYCAIPVTCDGGNGCRKEKSIGRLMKVQKSMVSFLENKEISL